MRIPRWCTRARHRTAPGDRRGPPATLPRPCSSVGADARARSVDLVPQGSNASTGQFGSHFGRRPGYTAPSVPPRARPTVVGSLLANGASPLFGSRSPLGSDTRETEQRMTPRVHPRPFGAWVSGSSRERSSRMLPAITTRVQIAKLFRSVPWGSTRVAGEGERRAVGGEKRRGHSGPEMPTLPPLWTAMSAIASSPRARLAPGPPARSAPVETHSHAGRRVG